MTVAVNANTQGIDCIPGLLTHQVPEEAAEAAAEASPPLAEAAADAELESW